MAAKAGGTPCRACRGTQEQRNPLCSTTRKETAAKSEPAEYAYHLGDKVYLGAGEFEILHFDDKRVTLYDTQFPLFNKEMERAEFDRKMQENPMNDHLKVTGQQPEEQTAQYDIGMGYLGNGLTVWNRAVEVNGDYQNIAHISLKVKLSTMYQTCRKVL